MGTPEFAVPSLDILLSNGYAVPAVVTAPDKPRGRGQQVLPTPIKELALSKGLRVLQPESLKDQSFISDVKSLDPDLIIVVAFRILPREVFTLPRLGAFNLHASLLPKYRGAAPINWAIINGEKETGVTSFFLKEKVDTGNLILQARTPIKPEDTAGTLHDRLSQIGAEIVLHTVRLIEQGKAAPKPQDDTLASPAPKLFKQDCKIDWSQPTLAIHNRIRGLAPYPAAFTVHDGKVFKIYNTFIQQRTSEHSPGTIVATKTSLEVVTGDGVLAILELQQEGKKRMSIEEFLRGYHFDPASHFG